MDYVTVIDYHGKIWIVQTVRKQRKRRIMCLDFVINIGQKDNCITSPYQIGTDLLFLQCVSKKSVNVLPLQICSDLSFLFLLTYVGMKSDGFNMLALKVYRLWEGCGRSHFAVRACMEVREDGETHCRALCILSVKLLGL